MNAIAIAIWSSHSRFADTFTVRSLWVLVVFAKATAIGFKLKRPI